MTQFTIHEPTDPPAGIMARADATRFVKEGMAWWALFLPMVWLLYHRMWLIFVGFVVAMFALEFGLYYAGVPDSISMWTSILFSIVFAMHANDLRRWTLSRRGFSMVGAVSGKGQRECELKYFASWPETEPPVKPPSTPAKPVNLPAIRRQPADRDAVIGLFPEPR